MSRSRLIFVVFYFTVVLIGAVHLRVTASRVFNQWCKAHFAQDNLKLQLGDRQLKLEHLLNPSVIFERIEKEPDPDK